MTAPVAPVAPRVVEPLVLVRGFADGALERAFWDRQGAERLGVHRVAIGLLFALVAGFAVVDLTVFRAEAEAMLRVRAVNLALMAPVLPVVYAPRFTRWFQRHAQEVLLYLALVTVGGLFPMGRLVAVGADTSRQTTVLMTALFGMILLHCVSGLRFRYAAPLGAVFTVLYFSIMGVQRLPAADFLYPAIAFLVGQELIGLSVCASLELSARRAFLRALDLERARRRSDELLLNLMPAALAERLRRGDTAPIDRHAEASVLFATVVGFDVATTGWSPLRAVALMDRLVSRFDTLAVTLGVERIKTVGATWMGVAGAPGPSPAHAVAVARLALQMRRVVEEAAADEGIPIRLRAGISSGPIVAGVLGRTRLAFDCWGDTANTAARLDSHGEPGRVQVTSVTAALLEGVFRCEPRGPVSVKGKGPVAATWVEEGP